MPNHYQPSLLLESLLLSSCFMPGATSHKDSNTKLFINKGDLNPDETLLFFHIDNQSNPDCELRQLFWQDEKGHNICDLLVFYAKGSNERIFCFVELKDNKSDFPKATEQVISTYKAFKQRMAVQFQSKYTVKAFICFSTGSLPQKHQNYQNELNKEFKNHFEHDGRSADFLKFLRGEKIAHINKGKNKRK